MSNFKAIIVVPTYRPKDIFVFLDKWKTQFVDHHIIITEDFDKPTIDFSKYPNVTSYSATEWKEEWGNDSWILSRGNAAHRCFGFWKAWQAAQQGDCDMVVTLDDDCYPDQDDFLQRHWELLQKKVCLEWVNSMPDDDTILMRGMPYGVRQGRQVMVNHGVWSNIPDLDAPTQLVYPTTTAPILAYKSRLIPRGTYFPMSGMNLAWRPAATPLLYFPLMGRGQPYDRFDDIWAGIFMKKCCDYLRWPVTSGAPSVHHAKLSDVFTNLVKESPGIKENESFWKHIDSIPLFSDKGDMALSTYWQLAKNIGAYNRSSSTNAFCGYFQRLSAAMLVWIDKFNTTGLNGRKDSHQRSVSEDAVLAG